MPYQIHWEPSGVYRRFHGDVTLAERHAALLEVCRDRRFDDLRYAITDYLEVQAYQSSPAGTVELAAMHIGPLFTNPRLIIAAVADREDICADIQHFMDQRIINAPYRTFRSLPEARAWAAQHPRLYGRPLVPVRLPSQRLPGSADDNG